MIELHTFSPRGAEIRAALIRAGVLRPQGSNDAAPLVGLAVAAALDAADYCRAAQHISAELRHPSALRALAGQPHVRPALAVALLARADLVERRPATATLADARRRAA